MVLDLAAIPICTAPNLQTVPAVAAAGGDFLVVWADFRNTQTNASHADIFGARIEIGSGKVLDTNGIPISLPRPDQNYPAVSSCRDQREFFVVWQDARDSVTNQPRFDIYGGSSR